MTRQIIFVLFLTSVSSLWAFAHARSLHCHSTDRFAQIVCLKVQFRNLDLRIYKLEKRLRKEKVTETYSKKEIDEKFAALTRINEANFVKYGGQTRIMLGENLCLHSGVFAGFEKCGSDGANAFVLQKNNPTHPQPSINSK